MSIAATVARGFGPDGSIPLVISRGYSIGEAVAVPVNATLITRGFGVGARLATRFYVVGEAVVIPVEEAAPLGGGDDAWFYKVKSKALEKKEDLAAALRALYNALPEEEKLEVKAVVAQYAEKKTPRRAPVAVANINFAKLAKSIAAIEALLKVYEETFQLDAEDEWESTLLLLTA